MSLINPQQIKFAINSHKWRQREDHTTWGGLISQKTVTSTSHYPRIESVLQR